MIKFDEKTMRALFTLAGIEVLQAWPLVNQYDADAKDPWWLVKTPAGLIKLGWRKRVIAIDWSDTAIRQVITDHEVTKDETMVHAWDTARAIEYLQQLSFLFENNQSHAQAGQAGQIVHQTVGIPGSVFASRISPVDVPMSNEDMTQVEELMNFGSIPNPCVEDWVDATEEHIARVFNGEVLKARFKEVESNPNWVCTDVDGYDMTLRGWDGAFIDSEGGEWDVCQVYCKPIFEC